MNILLLGSGGREHALAWKVRQSERCDQLYIAPGNAGTGETGTNISLDPNDFKAIGEFVLKNNIKMVIVGPEAPLVKGIHDYFLQNDKLKKVAVTGPTHQGAMLEGSKAFAKDFMEKNNIPTAACQTFKQDEFDNAVAYIKEQEPPVVLKADGLAAGKGVFICKDHEEAIHHLKDIFHNKKFGEAGNKVVIEQFLEGKEFSVFIVTDGKNYKILPSAKDYKRVGEKDTGLNTGGMGAVSPVPYIDDAMMEKVEQKIIKPTIKGLEKEDIIYKGFLYFGLIKVGNEPYVIEYNARLGDPETQVVLPLIKSDLVELLQSVHHHKLHEISLETDERHAVTVVLASEGYPGKYEKGKTISNISETEENKSTMIFHAGTAKNDTGEFITNGGRVLAITSLATSLKEALNKSYIIAEEITFEGKYYRKDIGFDIS